MSKKVVLFISILFFLFIKCNVKNEIFHGDIILIEKINITDSLKAERIQFDEIYTGYMSVYDTLITFLSTKYPDSYLYVFNANTGKHIGSYCDKGEGPNEFLYFTHASQYSNTDNEIKLWGYNDMNQFYLVNISRSIRENRTYIEKNITHTWRETHVRSWALSFVYEDNLLVRNQPESLYNDKSSSLLPAYCLYNMTTDTLLREYKLYNKFPNEQKLVYSLDNILYSIDRISIENKKIAMAMNFIPQINILDLESGKLKGIRLKESPDFTVFENENHTPFIYYTYICVNKEFIYALYADIELSDNSKYSFETREIHVFDWDGKMIRKIIIEHNASIISLDNINNYLYTMNDMDEVFRYNLNSLQ